MYSDHATTLETGASPLWWERWMRAASGMTGVLGGWSMAVSAFTPNKKEALEFVKWTASEFNDCKRMLGESFHTILFEAVSCTSYTHGFACCPMLCLYEERNCQKMRKVRVYPKLCWK
jgi:hypothetical protein